MVGQVIAFGGADCRVGEGTTRSQGRVHFRHFALDQLKLADWAAKLFAIVRIGKRSIAHGLHYTNRTRNGGDTFCQTN